MRVGGLLADTGFVSCFPPTLVTAPDGLRQRFNTVIENIDFSEFFVDYAQSQSGVFLPSFPASQPYHLFPRYAYGPCPPLASVIAIPGCH